MVHRLFRPIIFSLAPEEMIQFNPSLFKVPESKDESQINKSPSLSLAAQQQPVAVLFLYVFD